MNIRISPIPDGFSCVDDDTYDGTPSAIIGTGKTEDEALEEFWAKYDDQFAPLVTSDDYELEDLSFHRGNDWMTERDVAAYESGMRERDFS